MANAEGGEDQSGDRVEEGIITGSGRVGNLQHLADDFQVADYKDNRSNENRLVLRFCRPPTCRDCKKVAPQGVAGAIAAVILAEMALLLAAIAKKQALRALQLQSRQEDERSVFDVGAPAIFVQGHNL